jgi:hypothetical protein
MGSEETRDGAARGGESRKHRDGYLDEQEEESFPASDPHSDWAGPGPEAEGD